MFYPFKVNTALAELGVNPNKINSEYRRFTQQLAKRLGYTPQEAAVLLASQIPLEYSPGVNKINLHGWVNSGKVRLHISEIGQAVEHVISLFDDLSFR